MSTVPSSRYSKVVLLSLAHRDVPVDLIDLNFDSQFFHRPRGHFDRSDPATEP